MDDSDAKWVGTPPSCFSARVSVICEYHYHLYRRRRRRSSIMMSGDIYSWRVDLEWARELVVTEVSGNESSGQLGGRITSAWACIHLNFELILKIVLPSTDESECIKHVVYNISDFYISNRSLEISPSRDNQAHHFVTCAANTSEQCTYSWRGTYSDSSKSSDVLGPTIDLKSVNVEISSMRCRAECKIRNNVCVSETMYIKFIKG